MSALDMTVAEREAYLADLHVGVLSIAREGRGPLALPIWYTYEPGGAVVLSMDDSSLKARLLGARGRATLTAQTEAPPYKYVMVEGPITIGAHDHDARALAVRYLGENMGAWYAEHNRPGDDSVTVRLHPEQWLTIDYAKMT
jgi:nitroimidazol reductase NimA-like FMN-containing flavoprotein (pyridoxamine 5'-phosphate oxidase superfamily)